jgi:plasmid stabilization system protein ParE
VKYRVEVTARAEADIEEAYAWYAERSPEGAAKWHGELSRAINTLERFPERRRVAFLESEAVGLDIRRLVVGRDNALLHADGGAVYILTVGHGARKRLSKERPR